MQSDTPPPLIRWDGLHLVLDLERFRRHLERALDGVEQVDDLTLTGDGDMVRVGATVIWMGLKSRVAIELGEIRLKNRHLGLRVRRVRVLGGMPVPRAAVEVILKRLSLDGVTVFTGRSIVVMDLRRWLAPELEISIMTVQTTSRSIHVWLGPGELEDIPGRQPKALPADAENVDSTGSLDTEQALR
jgi:hypothetical protein